MNISRVSELLQFSSLRRLRAASGQFSQASLSVFSSVLRAGAVRVVSPAAGRCTAEAEADVDADAGSVWSCADADAVIGSASSSSEQVTPHTDEHRC